MIRVFPRRTKWTPADELAFVGDVPLFRPPEQPVRISCTFTWDLPEARRLLEEWGLYYRDVQIGGPALDDPGAEFEPSRFIKAGVTITSRGCPNQCPWCFVPRREGAIRELPIRNGWIIQDNNFLACSRGHIELVFTMLTHQDHPAQFNGGFETKRLEAWHIDRLQAVSIAEIWLACDSPSALPALERAAGLLHWLPQNKKRCYVLVGFNGEQPEEAEQRLQRVLGLEMLPFAQLYQDDIRRIYPKEWRDLARRWSRPAIYRSIAARGDGAT